MGFIKNITDKFNIKIFSIKEFEKVTSSNFENYVGAGYAFNIPIDNKNGTRKDISCILYDDTADEIEKNSIVLHELGHILLGHFRDNCSLQDEVQEREASIFASVILALSMYEEYKKAPVTDQSAKGQKENSN